ncbi:LOW QUALITY PROTEIN: flavin reductase (NADPH) [Rhynochetos jubatus]
MAAGTNLVIFGATGRTGRATLELALQDGYNVTVLVRDPARLPPNLRPTRVGGDVLDPTAVGEAGGQDGVIIVLGTGNDLSPTTVMSEGTRNIVAAMKTHGVRKVVACLSAFLLWDLQKVPARLMLTEDHIRMERVLRVGLECVYVLPPHITEGPLTGSYTVTPGALGPSRSISARDLGHFLLRCLRDPRLGGQRLHLGHQYR